MSTRLAALPALLASAIAAGCLFAPWMTLHPQPGVSAAEVQRMMIPVDAGGWCFISLLLPLAEAALALDAALAVILGRHLLGLGGTWVATMLAEVLAVLVGGSMLLGFMDTYYMFEPTPAPAFWLTLLCLPLAAVARTVEARHAARLAPHA